MEPKFHPNEKGNIQLSIHLHDFGSKKYQFSHPATEASKPWRFGFLCHAAWISGNTTSQCERHRRRRRWFFFWFFGRKAAANPEGWSGHNHYKGTSDYPFSHNPGWKITRRMKGKIPPWELTYPLPKRYFWVDDYVPFPKMGYVSSLEGRTWYHCVAMISKLFVPDPLWGRLIDILFRTMPLPNHVQPWQCIHKMVELQKPFVQTMDFMQMC